MKRKLPEDLNNEQEENTKHRKIKIVEDAENNSVGSYDSFDSQEIEISEVDKKNLKKAQSGDLNFIKKNLETIVDINAVDPWNNTLLNYAIIRNDFELVKLLVKKKAYLDQANSCCDPPVIVAAGCVLTDIQILKFLIDSGADPFGLEYKGYNIFHTVVNNSENIKKLEYLLSKKELLTIINDEGDYGGTPLELAAMDKKIIKLLIDHGANISFAFVKEVMESNNRELLEFVLQLQIDWNMKSEDGNNLLHEAYITKLNPAIRTNELIKFLLDNGVSENEKNNDGLTPIEAAEQWKRDNFREYAIITGLYDSDHEL